MTAIPEQSLILTKLPVELLWYMTNFLPLASVGCLALSCHTMANAIGTQCWMNLKDKREEKFQLLSQLERDTPSQHHCHHCARLHSHRTQIRPAYGRAILEETECIQANGHFRLGLNYHITYEHVQLAMKRYRLGGSHGIGLDEFFYRGWSGWWTSESLRDQEMDIQARIVGDELLIQKTLTTVLRPGEWIAFYLRSLQICPHYSCAGVTTSGDYHKCLPHQVQCRVQHSEDKSCTLCGGMMQCKRCWTEWGVEKRGPILIVTVWKNLGSGRSPHDAKWRGHVDPDRVYSLKYPKRWFSLGSIRASWTLTEKSTLS